MYPGRSLKSRNSVWRTGAQTGCILGGATESNKGLRIRILQAQPKGVDGPIGGVFQILDAGDNKHAEFLAPLLGKTADADTVLGTIRRAHPCCVNIVNTNVLFVEEPRLVRNSVVQSP